MSMFNDISWGSKDNEIECESNCQLVSLFAKRFGTGHWSFLGPGSEKKVVFYQWWDSPQGVWDNIAERMMFNSAKGDTQFSVPRVHCPEGSSKAKAVENCRYIIVPIWKRPRLRTLTSVNQLSLCGAVAEMCEEYWNHSRENGATRCDGAIEFLTRVQCDQDRSSSGLWWPCWQTSSVATIWRTNWKAVTTKLSKFCTDAGFSECCWNRTILHDERHCGIVPISCSGMSWRYFSKRWRVITTKRMDPREHQNWARIGSCNLLFAW